MLNETSQVTIVIPTLDRPDFVLRLLDYYCDNGFAGRILIGDSSGPAHFEPVKNRIAEIGSKLNAVHVPCAGLNTNAALARLNAMVETPYATFTGDDDYIVPAAMAQCVAFLNTHPDYIAAQGKGRAFELDRGGAFGQMRITGSYPMRGIDRKTAAYRLAWHMRGYTVTIFGIYRTPVWRKMWAMLGRIPDRAFGAELLPVCLSAVYGRIKLLNTLYLLRQGHPGTYHLAHPLDWFASPDWGPSYKIFLETLASEVARIDGTTKSDAESLVRGLFHEYLFANRGSLGYKAELFRMNAVTRLMPIYTALDRWLPPSASKIVRMAAVHAFNIPFAMVNWMGHVPYAFLRWFEQRRVSVSDRTRQDSMTARHAAERSASSNGPHSDA